MAVENERRASGDELYRLFLTGDEAAFTTFVELYEDDLSSFILGSVNDYHDAKHLTIETFAQLITGGGKYEGKSSIKTYLFGIGKNLVGQYLKTRRREQHLSYEEVVGVMIAGNETPYDLIEREESRRQLRETLKNLKNEYRVVLLLLYFEDMSYRQAGLVLQKSESQVRNLAHRAKISLKKKLESEGFSYL